MPTLDFAFLADAAEAEPGRKLYVLGGGIDQIAGPEFPLVHPHMALVMRFLVPHNELDRDHHLLVRLTDPDGKELARIEGTLRTDPSAITGLAVPVNMVLNMVSTRFETPGAYAIDIVMDGEFCRTLPLRIAKVSQA